MRGVPKAVAFICTSSLTISVILYTLLYSCCVQSMVMSIAPNTTTLCNIAIADRKDQKRRAFFSIVSPSLFSGLKAARCWWLLLESLEALLLAWIYCSSTNSSSVEQRRLLVSGRTRCRVQNRLDRGQEMCQHHRRPGPTFHRIFVIKPVLLVYSLIGF